MCWDNSIHYSHTTWAQCHLEGLVQYCSNSSALALELLQSCTKPLMQYLQCGCNGVTAVLHSAIDLKSSATWLFLKQLVKANNKGNIKALHYLTFARKIQWLLDSHHKGPVIQKVFPWHDFINNIVSVMRSYGNLSPYVSLNCYYGANVYHRWAIINHWVVAPYNTETNLVITAAADASAPDGARPSSVRHISGYHHQLGTSLATIIS